MSATDRVDLDQLAALEEERAFLLRSLDDLEREHAAGDVDDDDYATLRDEYTVRAANVLRAIESGRAALPSARPLDRRRLVIGLLVALVAVVVVGWLLTRSTTDRRAGDTVTGGPDGTDLNSLLVQARQLQTSDPLGSIKLYEQVLEQEPDNVEALTYRGWTAAFVALALEPGPNRDVLVQSATTYLDRATEVDPSYADAQCFTAIVRFRLLGDAEGAKEPLERCRAGDLPASVQGLVDALGGSIDDALAGNEATATTTATPAPTTAATTTIAP